MAFLDLLPGPDQPVFIDFSPDGAWIVYSENSDESLMKIALSGGAPRVVVPEWARRVEASAGQPLETTKQMFPPEFFAFYSKATPGCQR